MTAGAPAFAQRSQSRITPATPTAAKSSTPVAPAPKPGPTISGHGPMTTAGLTPSATADVKDGSVEYHLTGEPAILSKHVRKQAGYGDVKGKLIHHGIKVTDWDQKRIGDCWLVSGVSAVAQKNPQLVKDAIKSNNDGTYTVRLYVRDAQREQKDPRAPLVPVYVKVNDKVPLMDGKQIYAKGHNTHTNELWPAIVEKAAAQLRGGNYKKVVGGWGYVSMEMLTGQKADRYDTRPSKSDQLFDVMKTASLEGRPMVAGTFSKKEFEARLETIRKMDPQSPALREILDLGGKAHTMQIRGVVHGHAYTVLGVRETNGEKEVVLRNPWGKFEPPKGGFGHHRVERNGDGIFAMPMKHFALVFRGVDVGTFSGPSPTAKLRNFASPSQPQN